MSDSVRPHPWDSPGKNTGVGCRFLLQCIKVKSESEVAQSCLTRGDPMDCSLPGSCVHGIFQARVLEWGAIAFSKISTYYHFTHIYSYSYLFSVPSSLLPPADISVTTWHTCTYLHVMCSLPPMLECKLHIP